MNYLDRYGSPAGWRYLADLQFNIPFVLNGSQLTFTVPLNQNYLINAGTADMLPALPLQGTMLYFHDMSYHLILPSFSQYPDRDLFQGIWDTFNGVSYATHNTVNAMTTLIPLPFNIIRRVTVTTFGTNTTANDIYLQSNLASGVATTPQKLYVGTLTALAGIDLAPWGTAHGIVFGDPYASTGGHGSIAFQATNTTATNQFIIFTVYGMDMGWIYPDLTLTYIDLSNNQTALGHLPTTEPTGNIELDTLIPFATNNPTPLTYGTMVFELSYSTNIPNPATNLVISGSYILNASIVTQQQ